MLKRFSSVLLKYISYNTVRVFAALCAVRTLRFSTSRPTARSTGQSKIGSRRKIERFYSGFSSCRNGQPPSGHRRCLATGSALVDVLPSKRRKTAGRSRPAYCGRVEEYWPSWI